MKWHAQCQMQCRVSVVFDTTKVTHAVWPPWHREVQYIRASHSHTVYMFSETLNQQSKSVELAVTMQQDTFRWKDPNRNKLVLVCKIDSTTASINS